jgi:hypothetical protein
MHSAYNKGDFNALQKKEDPIDILPTTEGLYDLKARAPNSMRIKCITAYET